MADLARIKGNVAKMASQNAPEADIDGYIASEGVSLDDVRNFKASPIDQADARAKAGIARAQQVMADGGPKASDGHDAPDIANPNGTSDRIGAFVTGANDVPIIGPAMKAGASAAAAGLVTPFSDQSFAQNYDEMRGRQEQVMEENPGTAMGGRIAGTALLMRKLPASPTGSKLFGMTGTIPARVGLSAATNGLISGTDTAVRGGDTADVINNTVIGAGIGGAIPIGAEAVKTGLSAIGSRIAPVIGSILAPAKEAERRVGTAVLRDQTANPGGLVGPADEVAARSAGVQLLNADRGGETTRALARSVGNQSPEARATIEKAANDRFGGQGQRAASFIRRVAGGSADDLAYQQAIRDSARAANKPAYNRAYAAPAAQNMWNQDFQQLMQAPAMQEAATGATTRGANRAAVEGFQPVRNPFQKTPDGKLTLRVNADGSTARPTLQFWDQTKRNLDSMIGQAERSGDNTYAGDLKALKTALVDMTDTAVPAYKAARQGAAAFFGADDALEAGKKFVNTPRAVPEAQAAFAKFAPAEKSAFQTGFASELIDKINSVGDRSNVITQVFKSPAARSQIELVFGPQKAKQIEAYVRVEDLADKLRGAMGNSTTARQLAEMGIGAGAGYTFGGHDLKSATAGAALAAGARYGTKQIDQRVMQQVAKMLVSDDPKMIQSAVNQAALSPTYMKALESLSEALSVPVRSTAIATHQ